MTCTCNGFGCDVRIARGMQPFCALPPPPPRPDLSTREKAEAHYGVPCVRRRAGGLHGGAPFRWVPA